VHGCFWHRHPGCAKASMPKTREAYWTSKFDANVTRDIRVWEQLERLGWRVAVIWGCMTSDSRTLETILAQTFGSNINEGIAIILSKEHRMTSDPPSETGQ
jgi:DNA mismatch endonuclease (patch repair protein)